MPEADETIVTRFIVEGDAALQEALRLRSAIDELKNRMQFLASEGGLSLEDVAKAMIKTFGEDSISRIDRFKEKINETKATLQSLREQMREQVKVQIAETRGGTTFQGLSKEEQTAQLAGVKAGVEATFAPQIKEAQQRLVELRNEIIRTKKETQEFGQLTRVALQESNKEFAEYVAKWKDANATLTPAAQKIRDSIRLIKEEIQQTSAVTGQSFAQIGEKMIAAGQPANYVSQAVKELNSSMQAATPTATGFAGALQKLGTTAQYVFGAVFGLTVITAIRRVIDVMKEAIQAGFDYAKALNKLDLSTNILQEKGYNVTLAETYELIDRLNKEFPIFTKKQVVEGVGYIQLLSQNLELTNEQMENLAEVAASLGVILGKDVNEASKELALFLSSGYGEALQRAGILASKAAVSHELLAMGIEQDYNSVDQATRAQAGYNVIMRDAEKIREKAKTLQTEEAYALSRLNSAWGDLINNAGKRSVPALAFFYDGLAAGLRVLDSAIETFGKLRATIEGFIFSIVPAFVRSIVLIRDAFDILRSGGTNFESLIDEYTKSIQRIYATQVQARAEAIGLLRKAAEDVPADPGAGMEDTLDAVDQAVKFLHDEITNETDKFNSDMDQLERDLQRDLEEIDRQGNFRRKELWFDYLHSIAEINRKSADDVAAQEIKYQLDLAQLIRQFDQRREELEQKHRDRELKAQRDFEEKMRRLREEFLFDLEDALRERDARQVLRLIRRFNLEQARLQREREIETEERQTEYRKELEELERQRTERLRVLFEEHQARLAAIETQRQIELRELKIRLDEERAELARSLENQKEERRIKHGEQQEELKIQLDERLKEIATKLDEEYELTAEMLTMIANEYKRVYGQGGEIEAVYKYAMQLIGAMNQALAGYSQYYDDFFQRYQQQQIGTYQPYPEDYYQRYKNQVPGFASGGSMLATSPTVAKFGEVPELVNFTPLSQLNTVNVGKFNNSFSGQGGKIAIELLLSPDLQARIIDNTLDLAANVMLDIQRRR